MTYITTEDATLIVEAINNLKQSPDYFKDYILPLITLILGSIISASLAYFIARRTNDRAESIKMEFNKIDATNYFLLQAEFCLQNLINVKEQYFGRLTSNSYQRVLELPPFMDEYSLPRTKPIAELIFLSPKDGEPIDRWNQLTFINLVFENYDRLVNWIAQRNELRIDLTNSYLVGDMNKAMGPVMGDFQSGLDYLGRDKMVKLIMLTESIINTVDDLILFFDDFVHEFPAIAKGKLKEKMPDGMKTVLDFGGANKNDARNAFKERSAPLDYRLFAGLSGMELQQAQTFFKSIYTKTI